jgi:Flp pilus assembly protein TadD
LAIIAACIFISRTQLGYWRDSEALFRHALDVTAFNITAEYGLGKALADKGKTDEALAHFQQALNLKPDFAEVQGQVAQILAGEGKTDDAIVHYRKALQIKPALVEALNNLAWLFAAHPNAHYRNGPEAVALAERACELTKSNRAIFIGTLAAAYAEAGQFDNAIKTAQSARHVALQWKEKDVAAKNLELIRLYQERKAVRDPSLAVQP